MRSAKYLVTQQDRFSNSIKLYPKRKYALTQHKRNSYTVQLPIFFYVLIFFFFGNFNVCTELLESTMFLCAYSFALNFGRDMVENVELSAGQIDRQFYWVDPVYDACTSTILHRYTHNLLPFKRTHTHGQAFQVKHKI